jgi:hypothetical protein
MIKPNPVAFCKEIPLFGPFFRLNCRTALYGAKPVVDNSSLWVGNLLCKEGQNGKKRLICGDAGFSAGIWDDGSWRLCNNPIGKRC